MTVGERIKYTREKKGIPQIELANACDIKKQTLYKYENGIITNIPSDKIEAIADYLGVTPAYIMGWNREIDDLDKVVLKYFPYFVPGKNYLSDESSFVYNVISDTSENPQLFIEADFAISCKDNSMINARILDNDIVYIKKQSDFENGEIVAVLIDGIAVLRRIYKSENKLTLMPENPDFAPLVYVGEEINNIRILGKAVYFLSLVK